MRRATSASVLLALCMTLLATTPSSGAYDPIAGGSTEISLAPSFVRAIRGQGVRIEVHGGYRHGRRVTLPDSGGEVDPEAKAATVESEGTLVFLSGSRKLILRRIVFRTKRAPLYAKVGGGQLKLATGARLGSKRSGFGFEFTASDMRLTSKMATRLNKKLRLGKTLSAGEPLGRVRVGTRAATVHLKSSGRVYLAVAPAFASKLDDLFV